jgi:hypothetical protein
MGDDAAAISIHLPSARPAVSGIADPFNGHIEGFRICHVQRSDGWIEATWNNMSNASETFPWPAFQSRRGGRR